MKNIAKVFILLLALCMIIPCIAACNKDNGGHKTPPPSESGDTTTPSGDDGDNTGDGGKVEETTPDPYGGVIMPEKVDLSAAAGKPYVYKAYVRDFAGTSPDAHKAQVANGNNDYRCIDFWVQESESDIDAISFAVYNRNKRIESDFNCSIRQVSSDGSQLEHLLAAYTNGDGYDLTIMTAKPAAQAATQNLLRNLKGNAYLDLSHASFDQNSIKELSVGNSAVGNKLYFVSGDMNVSTMDVAGLSIVNMEFYADLAEAIVEEFEGDITYSNIYNIVLNNNWTMDTLLRIATLANIDIDTGDGELHVLPDGVVNGQEVNNKYKGGDTVGYHQYLYSALWYFYGSGGRITTMTEEGMPEFVIQNTTCQTLYDYIFDKFNRMVSVNTWIPHESSNILNKNFLTGDVLFADCSLFNVRTEIYPKATFEYGILPIPLYEAGMDYKSVVYFNNWAHLWAIPSLTENEENAFRMMQIMAAYSSLPESTMYAYYDRTIYLLAAPETNGSRPVMDIIRTSMVYDLALLYPDWGGIETKLYQIPNILASEHAGIVEGLSRVEDTMLGTIEQLLNPGT